MARKKSLSDEASNHLYYTIEVTDKHVKIWGVLTAHDAGQFLEMYAMKGYVYVHPDPECSLCLEQKYDKTPKLNG